MCSALPAEFSHLNKKNHPVRGPFKSFRFILAIDTSMLLGPYLKAIFESNPQQALFSSFLRRYMMVVLQAEKQQDRSVRQEDGSVGCGNIITSVEVV